MPLELPQLGEDLAKALMAADALRPVARGRSKEFRPGIGPHSEDETVRLASVQLESIRVPEYLTRVHRLVAYSSGSRQKCDLCIGEGRPFDWAVEVKLLRFLGDNGKPNDNMIAHLLSPYPEDRSALTDCEKLLENALGRRCAVVIIAYECRERRLELAIEAFECLARARIKLGPRVEMPFSGLVHPVHQAGTVFGWEILGRAAAGHASGTDS